MDQGPGKPLSTKLGIRHGMRVTIVDPPENYGVLLGELPEGVILLSIGERQVDVAQLFVRDRKQLETQLPELKSAIAPNGMVWVSWPKRSSGVATDLTENVIRDLALAEGLVDVKVCSVDETWSALKLVIRVTDR